MLIKKRDNKECRTNSCSIFQSNIAYWALEQGSIWCNEQIPDKTESNFELGSTDMVASTSAVLS
jgi:hypothetical protein